MLEYGSVVWDPYLEKDITLLESVQRKAARFITGDYRSRDPGSITNMLLELDLPTLQSRRKNNRLTFLFKISKGLVPAIPRDKYLTPIRTKRKIRAKTFKDCVSVNLVERHQNLNENSYELPPAKSKLHRNSYFPKTIAEWNQLEGITADTVEGFKGQIQHLSSTQ